MEISNDHGKAKSKGTWVVERSSGHMGSRCLICGVWAYADQPQMLCDCDKPNPKHSDYKGEKKQTPLDRLLELVDGAKTIVEIWDAKEPAQVEWKKQWLQKASEELSFAESHKCKHEYWFRCKCGRPVCRKCEKEYEEK